MVLPFEPLSMTFQHIYYSVDVPAGSEVKGDQVLALRAGPHHRHWPSKNDHCISGPVSQSLVQLTACNADWTAGRYLRPLHGLVTLQV